jgi:hypothetical protein
MAIGFPNAGVSNNLHKDAISPVADVSGGREPEDVT